MNYEIKLDNEAFERKIYAEVRTYFFRKSIQLVHLFFIALSLIIIILNSIYPSFVMDAMEKNGLIKYVEFTRVHTRTSHIALKNYSMKIYGDYLDQDNKEHLASINIFLGFDLYEKAKNNKTLPGAYYTFSPSWEFAREPSLISLAITYSILLFCLYSLIKNKCSLKKIVTEFCEGKLIRPISFGYKTRSKNKKNNQEIIIGYDYYVLWETPLGNFYEDIPSHESLKLIQSMPFDSEYCGIFLKHKNGDFLIVRPQYVPEVKKKYNLAVNTNTLKVTTLRK